MDWNRSSDPTKLISDEPSHPDALVLAAVATVVHALAARDQVAVPAWAYGHRAAEETALFGHRLDSPFGRWIRSYSPAECEYHRVYFHAGLLDKGTERQWTPRAV